MKKNETETPNALDHVDPQRRGFLAKMLAGSVALPVISTVALAETPQDGKGKGGAGGKGKSGKGKGGAGGKGKGGKGKGQNGANAGSPDSSRMAARLIEEFDRDGDKALNAKELSAALSAMRERMGSEGGIGKGKGKGDGTGKGKGKGDGAGKGKGKGDGAGKGKGKGKGNGETEVSKGVIPKKPASE